MSELNRKKQYRAEIRTHVKAGRQVHRDYQRAIRDNLKEMTRHERAAAQCLKVDARLAKSLTRANAKIANRILVLQGRLNSKFKIQNSKLKTDEHPR